MTEREGEIGCHQQVPAKHSQVYVAPSCPRQREREKESERERDRRSSAATHSPEGARRLFPHTPLAVTSLLLKLLQVLNPPNVGGHLALP